MSDRLTRLAGKRHLSLTWLEGGLRAVLRGDGDYAGAGKPACDYHCGSARGELVDALASDAHAPATPMER